MNKDRIILNKINTFHDLDIEMLEKYNLGVEVQDFTDPNLSEKEIRNILEFYKKKFLKFKGIKTMHGPFIDLKPTSPDDLIRKVSYKKYYRAMEAAIELDMDYIVFHSQINPNHIGEFIEELNNKQNKDFWYRFLKKFSEFKGIVLIENVFEKEPKILKRLIEEINHPNVKINLDIGHAKLGDVDLEIWIKELYEHIAYMHIHSNNGEFDEHNAPSKSEIANLYRLLNKYKINPPLSLEYKIDDMSKEIKKYR